MPIENEGTPTNWTLSFKHDNITILLYAEPLTPLPTLKADLLSILHERYPTGLPHFSPSTSSPPSSSPESPTPHPSTPTDIILGKRVNENDEEEGWQEIDSAGKKDTPKSAGLSDGSHVVFAYKEEFAEKGFLVRRSTFYEDQARADEEAEGRGEDYEMGEGEDGDA